MRTSSSRSLSVKICRPFLCSSASDVFLDVRRCYEGDDCVRMTSCGVCIKIDLHDLSDMIEKLERILRGGCGSTTCERVEFRRFRQLLKITKLRAAPGTGSAGVSLRIGSDDARFLLVSLREFHGLLANDSGFLLNFVDEEEVDDVANEISWL